MSRSLRSGRLVVAVLVFAGATGVAVWQQLQGRDARRNAARLGEELAALRLQRTAEEESLAARRRELDEQRIQSAVEAAKLAKARHDAELAAAPTLWAEPPAQLPAWDPASPYVWLSKASLPDFPVSVFDAEGRMGADIAALLVVPPETLRQLNGELSRLLAEARAAEAARAERTEEHLAGISGGEGEKLTIKVPPWPEEGARLRRSFEETLRRHLGEGRAELVQKTAAGWLDSQFSQSGQEARIVSVLRHADGTYNIAVQAGSSWLSIGGMTSIAAHIPPHLRSHFAPLTDAPRPTKAGTP